MNENVVGVFHISTGNPHLVVFVKYFDEAQFNMVAPQLASAPDFKSGVNITFAEVKENELFLNVLERGAGRTPACGTAAFATAFAAQHASLLGKESVIKVHQEGGSLTFLKKQSWHMIGPAHISFEGQYFYNP
jgi:diaminopimelate epimerase